MTKSLLGELGSAKNKLMGETYSSSSGLSGSRAPNIGAGAIRLGLVGGSSEPTPTDG